MLTACLLHMSFQPSFKVIFLFASCRFVARESENVLERQEPSRSAHVAVACHHVTRLARWASRDPLINARLSLSERKYSSTRDDDGALNDFTTESYDVVSRPCCLCDWTWTSRCVVEVQGLDLPVLRKGENLQHIVARTAISKYT